MANVRVSQIGQTAVNKPFFEVLINDRRYVAMVNADNNVEFVSSTFLKSLGVCSLVYKQYYAPDNDVRKMFKMAGFVTDLDTRFPYQNLGSGFAFYGGFSPLKGFIPIIPGNAFFQTL